MLLLNAVDEVADVEAAGAVDVRLLQSETGVFAPRMKIPVQKLSNILVNCCWADF
jgi:hypothetical protein